MEDNRVVTFNVEDYSLDGERVIDQWRRTFDTTYHCTWMDLLKNFEEFVRGMGYVLPDGVKFGLVNTMPDFPEYTEESRDPWPEIIRGL